MGETEEDWKNDCALIYKPSLNQFILKGKEKGLAHIIHFFECTSNVMILMIPTLQFTTCSENSTLDIYYIHHRRNLHRHNKPFSFCHIIYVKPHK